MDTKTHPLRAWIESEGLVQQSVARAVGMRPDHLNHVLAGRSRFTMRTASAVEKYTQGGVTVAALVAWDEARKRRNRASAEQAGAPRR